MSREESRDYLGGDAPTPVNFSGGGAEVTITTAPPVSAGGGRIGTAASASAPSLLALGTGATTQARTDLDVRDLAAQYGLDYNEIQAVPELAELFRQAVQAGYSAQRFTALLKNTNWWRTTSETQRQFFDLQTSDPATWQQKWTEAAYHANAIGVQLGIPDLLAPGTNMPTMNWALREATKGIMAQGWSDDRVKSYLGGLAETGTWTGNPLGGEMARNYTMLHQVAYLNGRNYTGDWYNQQVSRIAGGHLTMDQVEGQIRQEAAADYKGFSTQILAGQDAMTLAAPYLHSVSTLLEKPEGSLGLDDPLMRKAMTTTDKNGQAYSTWQLEQDTRNDERWKSTQNAQDSTMKLARGVLGDFGFAY